MATRAEQNWRPQRAELTELPSLTEQEYVGQALGLPTEGRQHLLRLLFLLIRAELSIWVSTAGPDAEGHWCVTFDRDALAHWFERRAVAVSGLHLNLES